MKALASLLLVLVFQACTPKMQPPAVSSNTWETFSMGADLSYVNQIEDYGGVYRDSGQIRDPFRIFRDHGCNTVRVRLWHNPQWYAPLTGGKLYSDLHDVEKTIRRAKELGMAVNLDFHYSDIWADPQRQETPAAWQGLDLPTLKDSVYRYTLSVLEYLESRGLTPEMVQIGNETNPGMMHPVGLADSSSFADFGSLLNSGIRAVRDFSAHAAIRPQIIIHEAQLQTAEEWVERVTQSGKVHDYDIIGLSHYDKWSTVTAMDSITAIVGRLRTQYGKKVILVETGYPWTSASADTYGNIVAGDKGVPGYGVSPEEQLRYMKDLTQAVIDGGGSGVQVWEPAWITSSLRDLWGAGSPWENMTFFDFDGNALPGIDFMRHPYRH